MLTQVEIFSERPSVESLVLPLSDIYGTEPIRITDITGLDPVKAAVTSAPYGSVRGESLVGTSLGKRNIVISVGLNPNWIDQTVASLRQLLYQYFMPQLPVRIQFTNTHLPLCEISGVVESMEANIFSKTPEIQISIICTLPDFVAVAESTVSGIGGIVGFPETPTDIDYVGSLATGILLDVYSGISDPADELVIEVGQGLISKSFQVTATLNSTTSLQVSSLAGNKYARSVTIIGGEFENILNDVLDGAIWPTLEPGANTFRITGTGSNLTWSLSYFARFGGL